MSSGLQYWLAVVAGVVVAIAGMIMLAIGGGVYSIFGWLLISVGVLTTAANVVVARRQRR
jgi:cytochrome b subunit of formate dehydrogenase